MESGKAGNLMVSDLTQYTIHKRTECELGVQNV